MPTPPPKPSRDVVRNAGDAPAAPKPKPFQAWADEIARVALANLKEGLEDEAKGGPQRAEYLAGRKEKVQLDAQAREPATGPGGIGGRLASDRGGGSDGDEGGIDSGASSSSRPS